MSCLDVEGIKREAKKGKSVKEIAHKFLLTEETVEKILSEEVVI